MNSLEPRLSRFDVRLLLLTGASWAIQGAELVLLNFTRELVTNDIKMGTPVLEVFGLGLLMGSSAGGPVFGHVADRFGRRTALIIAICFSLAGLAVSARAKVESVLILGRVITGLGFGGQLASTFVLVQELTPRSVSGRVIALLNAFSGLGGLLGVALAYAVAPQLGWRTTYFMTSGLALYTVVLYFALPESPRWLASVGRTEEAVATVETIERFRGVLSTKGVAYKADLQSTSVQDLPTLETKPSRLKRLTPTLVLWTLWIVTTVSSYTLGIYVPTLISLNGYNVFASRSTLSALKVAQVLGSIAAAAVVDAYGPHRCFAVFAGFAATLAVVLSYLTWSRAVVVVLSFVVTVLLSACWSCVLAYTPVHFKLTHRGRGMGYAVGVSRLVAVGGCLLYPHMYNVWTMSVSSLCWIFGGLLVLVGVSIGVVPNFGYQPLAQEDDTTSYALTSITDLEKNVTTASTESSDAGEESVAAT